MADLRDSTLVTSGALAWKTVWRRNKNDPPTSTSAKFLLSPTAVFYFPQKPEPTHLADTERGLDYANRNPSPKSSPPPAYSPRLMKTSSAKKSTPALSLDVSCNAEATQLSPLRSASFNPSTKTQSLHMSVGAKKLYVDLSSWHSEQRRCELTHHFTLPAPD